VALLGSLRALNEDTRNQATLLGEIDHVQACAR
jgi:hypothetical protein